MDAHVHPRDDLVRAVFPGVELRDADPDAESPSPPVMRGHFSVFDKWYEVDSLFEGRFMERIAPGAFADTIAQDRTSMRVLFQHGNDPVVGDKPLGPIDELEEDSTGPRYAVPLLDTSYNRDIEPGLRAGLYGSSFRFNVRAEEWDNEPKKSRTNPERLPERTITNARVFEFGPVTFPANPAATAGVRSLTDEWRSARSIPSELVVEPVRRAAAVKETIVEDNPVVSEPTDEYRDVGDKRAAIEVRKARLQEIDAEAQSKALTADQQVEWDRIDAEIEALQRDVADWERRQARLISLMQVPPAIVPVDSGQSYGPAIVKSYEPRTVAELRGVSRNDDEFRGLLRDHAMRRVERIQNPAARKDGVVQLLNTVDEPSESNPFREIARRIISTDDPAYVRAFKKYVRTGKTDSWTTEERAAALAVGVDGTGGYSVPVSFDPTIIATGAWNLANPFRAVCRIVTIAGTDTWQALTAGVIAADYALEAAAATEQGPTFTRPEFIVKRAHTFVTVSYEMMQDRPDIAGELTTLFAEAKDNLEATQFAIGVGTTVYPQGMGLKDAVTRVDSITNDTLAVGDITALEAAVPIRHRAQSKWFLSRAAIRWAQGLETAYGLLFGGVQYPSVGDPATNPGGNTGLSLLGHPVMETPAMPWTPTTDDTTWGVLMDPQKYVIVDRVGMSVKVIPDMLDGATPSFPTGQSGVYAFWRNTARVLDVNAGRQGAVQ